MCFPHCATVCDTSTCKARDCRNNPEAQLQGWVPSASIYYSISLRVPTNPISICYTLLARQAAEGRCGEQEEELAVLGAELARVRAVAARATNREVAGGTKDEGVVPVGMHLDEVRAADWAPSPTGLG